MSKVQIVCPECGSKIVEVPEGSGTMAYCQDCGMGFDMCHPAVQRDVWLQAHGLHPTYTIDHGFMYEDDEFIEREILGRIILERQTIGGVPICVVCLKGIYGDMGDIHEAIAKRGDLPNDPRIMAEINCVAIHRHCHKNTKEVDGRCAAYLISHYGILLVAEYLLWLRVPNIARANDIINRAAEFDPVWAMNPYNNETIKKGW